MCLLDQESNARSDRLGVGATPAKVAAGHTAWHAALVKVLLLQKDWYFPPSSTLFYLYTSLQEFYHLRTNLQKSCSLWAKQQERPWIEGSGSGMYSCTQRPDSNTQAQVLPSSFRGFEERKKKQNTLCKAVDSGWSWKIKVIKQVPWTTRYLLGFIAGACATVQHCHLLPVLYNVLALDGTDFAVVCVLRGKCCFVEFDATWLHEYIVIFL